MTAKAKKTVFVTSFIGYCSEQIYAEIVSKCKERGDEICVYHCNGSLRYLCDIAQQAPFFDKKHYSCKECMDTTYRIFGKICHIPSDHIIPYTLKKIDFALPEDLSYADFVQSVYEDFDYGMAVIGELATGLGKYRLSPQKYYDVYNNLSALGIALYVACKQIFQEHGFHELFVFNGRLLGMRAPLRAAQNLGMATTSFEFHDRNSFLMAHGNYVQDRNTYRNLSLEILSNTNDFSHGRFFFEKLNTSDNEFTSNFLGQALPLDFNSNLINIVFFNTTFYEMCSINEYINNEFLPEQDSTLLMAAICSYFHANSKYHFYIRIHPNMKSQYSSQIEDLRTLASLSLPNLTIIWPEESVNSYALLKKCQKVVSFGSTMGVEATYWGKPSIVCGNNLWAGPEFAYYPKTFRELIQLLETEDLAPKNQSSAIKWGYVQQKRGTPFLRSVPENKFSLKSFIKRRTSSILKKFINMDDMYRLQDELKALEKRFADFKMEYYKQAVSEEDKSQMVSRIKQFIQERLGDLHDI